MKFQIESGDMLHALTLCSKAMRSRVSNPVFSKVCIFYDDDDKRYKVIGGDSDYNIVTGFNMTIIQGTMDKPICFDPTQFLAALPTFGNDTVLTCVVDSSAMSVEYIGGQMIIPYTEDSYPMPKRNVNPSIVLNFDTDMFVSIMSQAVKCTSPDKNRPALTNVLLDVTPEGCAFVATNGNSMYVYDFNHGIGAKNSLLKKGSDAKILFRPELLNGVRDAFVDSDSINMTYDDNRLEISDDKTLIVARLSDAVFPKYKPIVDMAKNGSHEIKLSVKEMQLALKRILLFSDVSRATQLIANANDNKVEILSKNDDMVISGKAEVPTIDTSFSEDFKIAFNGSRIQLFTSFFNKENMCMVFKDKDSAMYIREDDATSPLSLVLMPLLM